MLTKAIICALNEAPSIGPIVAGSRQHVDEVVVIDGDSTDGTCQVATKEGARCEILSERGKGRAIRYAIDTEQADILVFIDADGSHDPADIPALVEPIVQGQADLVIGDRNAAGSEELHDSLDHVLRRLGSWVIRTVINLRFGVRLGDVQNGYRAIRADVARALGLEEDIFTIEQEMVMKALLRGYRVINVPATSTGASTALRASQRCDMAGDTSGVFFSTFFDLGSGPRQATSTPRWRRTRQRDRSEREPRRCGHRSTAHRAAIAP